MTTTPQAALLKFTKKPVTIEAAQWFKHGDHHAVVAIPADHPIDRNCIDPSTFGWVPTLEGGHVVTPGDWIIQGVKGEFYPCKPDIFAATYEPAKLQATQEPVQATDTRKVLQQAEYALWVCSEHNALHHGDQHNTVTTAIDARNSVLRALAALPVVEPAQAGESPDEREAFERAMGIQWPFTERWDIDPDKYKSPNVQQQWQGWQACAALAARKPLTADRIDEIANSIHTEDPMQWWRNIARAVERAHGINGMEVKT